MNFHPIPSTDGAYEMNKAGVVRNAKTKKKLTPVYRFKTDGEQRCISLKSLLWEVFGIKRKGLKHNIPVTAKKNGIGHFFNSLIACSKFIAKKENCSWHSVMNRLRKREKNVHGWNINYSQ